MKRLTYLMLLFISVVFFSCEKKLVFTSEKKLNDRIQGEWDPIKYTSSYGSAFNGLHVWRFDNGTLYVSDISGNGIDTAGYSIDAKIENPTVNIDGFKSALLDSSYGFNVKWTIIQLDNNVLDIVGNPFDGGLVELEFEKK